MCQSARRWRSGPHTSRIGTGTRVGMTGRFIGAYVQAVFAEIASACFLGLPFEVQTKTCRPKWRQPSLTRRNPP